MHVRKRNWPSGRDACSLSGVPRQPSRQLASPGTDRAGSEANDYVTRSSLRAHQGFQCILVLQATCVLVPLHCDPSHKVFARRSVNRVLSGTKDIGNGHNVSVAEARQNSSNKADSREYRCG